MVVEVFRSLFALYHSCLVYALMFIHTHVTSSPHTQSGFPSTLFVRSATWELLAAVPPCCAKPWPVRRDLGTTCQNPGCCAGACADDLQGGRACGGMQRFLQQAVPMGLNLALVELGRLPRVDSLEETGKHTCMEARRRAVAQRNILQEPTRSMCLDVITNHAVDGQHISRTCHTCPDMSSMRH